MNISDYGYSYANRIGTALRYPLYKVGDNTIAIIQNWHTDSFLVRIVKVAMRCLITAVCIVPASLLWLLGKGICLLGKTQIRKEGLGLKPFEDFNPPIYQILIKAVQDYKENSIIHEISYPIVKRRFINYNSNNAFLKLFRQDLGKELGLKEIEIDFKRKNTSTYDTSTKGYLKWVFMQKYENVNRLVSEVHSALKDDGHNDYRKYLKESICLFKWVKEEEAVEFLDKHFYKLNQGKPELTKEAVNFMLKTIGVLK